MVQVWRMEKTLPGVSVAWGVWAVAEAPARQIKTSAAEFFIVRAIVSSLTQAICFALTQFFGTLEVLATVDADIVRVRDGSFPATRPRIVPRALSVFASVQSPSWREPRFSDQIGVSCIVREQTLMATTALYIERREQGGYAVRKPGSERASAVRPTQAEAIETAREMHPDAAIHVERVRDTNVGGRDKWRKI